MPRTITAVDTLQEYIEGVMGRAGHHAPNIDEIALAVAGAIIWRKDSDDLKVMARAGHMGNVLWVHVSGARYAVSYNHDAQSIEVRAGSTHGTPLASFTNATPIREVKAFFEAL